MVRGRFSGLTGGVWAALGTKCSGCDNWLLWWRVFVVNYWGFTVGDLVDLAGLGVLDIWFCLCSQLGV